MIEQKIANKKKICSEKRAAIFAHEKNCNLFGEKYGQNMRTKITYTIDYSNRK